MAVNYNAGKIITDGLVLALDAGNPKNYNTSISTNWMDKIGGNNGTLVNGTYYNDGPFVGAGYVEFDGSGDYLTTANHASDFSFGSSDFTMEFWINSTKTGRSDPIGWNYNYTSAGWAGMILNISPGSGSMAWYENANSRISGSGSWNDGSWHHIAVTRDGNSVRIFLDGTQVGSTYTTSHSYGAASSGLIIGDIQQSLGSGPVDGQISNVRVLKGTALYTSNFTPPTGPLTAVTNTVLLTCQGNTIADASSSSHTITANGDAAARLGFPASAFEFDGTDDYVEVARSDDFDFGTGDLTIESWVYLDTYNAEGNMLVYKTQSSGSAGNACGNYVGSGGLLYMSASDNTTYKVNVTGGTVTLNRWHHICMTRVGSTWTCYLNTTQVSTATWAGSVSHVTTGSFGGIGIGAYTSAYGGNAGRYSMDGKISGVKIYKGKGLTQEEVQQNYNATKSRYQ